MEASTTEEKIIQAGVEEFAEHGFDGARIDRIASRGNINKAMIYYHYRGKEALYESVLSMIVTGIYEKVKSVVPHESSAPEQLEAFLRGYGNYLSVIDQNYIRIMLREVGSGGKYFKKITVPKLIAPAFALIAEIVQGGIQKKEFRELEPAFVMVQSMSALVFYNLLRITLEGSDLYPLLFGEGRGEQYIDSVVTVLKQGILTERGK